MRLLVIGQTVEDHFMRDDKPVTAPGGIYYAAAALHYIKDIEDEIVLCTSVEEKNYSLYADVYNNYDKKFMTAVKSVPKVWLTINPDSERSERYSNITASLNPDFNVSGFDGILLNMVTGFDISLEQLKKLKSDYNGLIYFDVHTLSRGLDESNNRNFRTIPDFEQWAKCVNILQVNTNELFTLSDFQTEHEIISWLLSLGITAVIITLDEKGAKYYYSNRGEKASYFQSVLKVDTENKIGCGDVFGSVFFYHYLKNKNLNSALSYANCAAGCIASYSDIKLIKNLKNDIIRQTN